MILTPSRFFLSKIAIGPAAQLETKQYVHEYVKYFGTAPPEAYIPDQLGHF